MSGLPTNIFTNTNSTGSKKAVHVKWAGKTIALGTFPAAEADEKCARAKALTRAWRSTMRPKPSRDWVMVELERLGVRVVSGRLGRKAGEEEEAEKKANISGNNSMGWSSNADIDNLMQQRRSSSLGLSMMTDKEINPRNTLSALGPLDLDPNDPTMPPHRRLVGEGAAAAYEAARADHYAQKREEQQRRNPGLNLGVGAGNLGGSGMLSVNPNQHYEMLKLHHMNLLNEIQETTLMMNLYQQQQLQQQQQQLQQQQQASVEGNDQLTMLQQLGGGGGMENMYGSQRSDPPLSMLKSQQSSAAPGVSKSGSTSSSIEEAVSKKNAALQEELLKSQKEQEALERELKKLKDDIAKQGKKSKELQEQADDANAKVVTKRSAEEEKTAEAESTEPEAKKAKIEAKEEKSDESKSEAKGSDDEKPEEKQSEDKESGANEKS